MDTATKEIDAIKLSSIEISRENISELDGKKVITSIPKNDILTIVLKYGNISERIVLQLIFSIFTILFGLYIGFMPTIKLIYDIYSNAGVDIGHTYPHQELMIILFPIFFIPSGIYFFIVTLRRRYYLLITTQIDKRKFVFNDMVTFHELSLFICTAKEKYGYAIESDLKIL